MSAMNASPRGRLHSAVAAALALLSGAAGAQSALAPPAPGRLPLPAANWIGSGTFNQTAPRPDPLSAKAASMLIEQASARGVLNWQSFDIGANASVRFNHLAGPASATLNRIAAGMNPTQIFGSLTANGQVYLYNQNGIIFGQGAQVNVGALVASSLNITDELFNQQLSTLTGVQPAFQWDSASAASLGIDPSQSVVQVSDKATLTAADGGRILLLAPKVVNNGTISTPGGQAVLASGGTVYVAISNDPQLRGLLVEVNALPATVNGQPAQLSEVVNDTLGKIVAERGNVTLAALAVNQSGIVRATTSVNLNGSIRLLARDTVVANPNIVTEPVPIGSRPGALRLGEGSLTEVQPDASDTNTVQDSQTFVRSRIEMVGGTVRLDRNAVVQAPGGDVDIAAQSGTLVFQNQSSAPTPGVRFYMDSGARIDVSGLKDVEIPIERNVVEVELRGNELRDSPLQRDSFLRNKTVRVDVRKGTPLADVSGQIAQIGRGIREKSTAGGSVRVRSDGDIILRDGASVDVSGGSIRYLDGYIDTTRLSSNGQVFDIAKATPDRLYDGMVDTYSVSYGRWGVTETFHSLVGRTFEQGYVEGKDAGRVELVGRALALDGTLTGQTVSGRLQRDASSLPLPGLLILGDQSGLTSTLAGGVDAAVYKMPDVVLQRAATPLPDSFGFDSNLAPFASPVTISLDRLQDGGMDRLAIYSEGSVRLARGSDLLLAPRGLLTVAARQIDIDSSVTVTGPVGTPIANTTAACGLANLCSGEIRLATRTTPTSSTDPTRQRISIGADVALSARGTWVNDAPALSGTDGGRPRLIDGGSIVLDSAADLLLGARSLVDVSGGAYADAAGTVTSGNPGSITLRSGRFNLTDGAPEAYRVVLGGDLRGYGINKGGALTVRTGEIVIGNAPGGASALSVDPGFFQRGGFGRYTITGGDALTVGAGSQVVAAVDSLVLPPGYALAPSGTDIFSIAGITRLPADQRSAVALKLLSTNLLTGHATLEEGSAISVDRGGSVTVQGSTRLAALGTIAAPAGAITLSLPTPSDTNDGFFAGHGIWLGADTRLLAAGTFIASPNRSGLLKGTLYDGGSVTIAAGRGYIVAPAGAQIDVSGATAMLDLPSATAGGRSLTRTQVAGSAGSVSLSAREGILFDGTFLASPSGASARGGSLSVTTGIPKSIQGTPAFPFSDRVITLGRFGSVVPQSLAVPGTAIDTSTYSGRTMLDIDRIAAGRFDSLSLQVMNNASSADGAARVELAGTAGLTLRSNLLIDAPVIANVGGGDFALHAANVSLGYSDTTRQRERAATGGSATLSVDAGFLELFGNLSLQGFGSVRLTSAGDLRLRGVQDFSAALPESTRGRTISGGLFAGAESLTLHSAQTYPTTFSAFDIALRNTAAGVVRFEGSDAGDIALSAGGTLTVEAPVIDQAGVLKAPFGSINLNAGTTLTLAKDSLTSVSGAGQVIPFGRTELTGHDWVFPLGNGISVLFEAPPAKSVALNGANVTVAPGAHVDLTGGGDLYAYEFLRGTGGTKDVLDPASFPAAYAIVPWLGTRASPYDSLYQGTTTGLAQGDLVYLAGATGLAAGYYRLLPARYALLPGAFLVTPKPGSVDMLPGQVTRNALGSEVVAGYRATVAYDGTVLRDGRTSGFEVRSASVLRKQSEYRETTAGAFFAGAADAQLPRDAGGLLIGASQTLSVQGDVASGFAAGGRGADVDIAASKLAVVGAGGTAGDLTGFVTLAAEDLRHLHANSLLLGGSRAAEDGGSRISVQTNELRVGTSTADPLAAPELILVAKSSIDVAAGSVVSGTGAFGGAPRHLQIGKADPVPDNVVSGDGALVRVSSAPQVGLNREAVTNAAGALTVAADASVSADRSMILDATKSNSILGSVTLGAEGALRLGAERISIGDVPSGTPGLTVSNAIFTGLPTLSSLALRSYSTVDLYGAAALGSADLASLSIESAGIVGYADPGATARLIANAVTLANPDGRTSAASCAGCANLLSVDATARIELAGMPQGTEFALQRFGSVTLSAGEIVTTGAGKAHAYSDLMLKADRIGAGTGSDFTIASDAKLQTALLDSAATANSIGGRLTLEGARLQHGGAIVMPSGSVTLRTKGTSNGDDLKLLPGSSIVVSSAERTFADRTVGVAAGSVTLESGHDLSLDGTTLDLAGLSRGDAGTLRLTASSGSLILNGAVTAIGTANTTTLAVTNGVAPVSGSVFVDAQQLDFTLLNRTLNAGGFAERREVQLRSGSLTVASGDANKVVARNVVLSADDGDVTVDGTIDASGPKGGSITLAANRKTVTDSRGNVVLTGNAKLIASSSADPSSVADPIKASLPFGTRGQGGTVLLSSTGTAAPTDAGVDVQSGAQIDISSAGVASNGTVVLRTPRTGISESTPGGTGVLMKPFAGTMKTNEGGTAATLVVEGTKVYTTVTIDAAAQTAYNTESSSFVAAAAASAPASFVVRPGVEVQSTENLTLAADWNLFPARYPSGAAGQPGTVTLRAAGDLLLNGSLSDGFSSAATTASLAASTLNQRSWSYRLVGGADLGAANPLATINGAGGVTLAAGKLVRTGIGSIDIAAGSDFTLGSQTSVVYTAGQRVPTLANFAVSPLGNPSAAAEFPFNGGDITINARGSVIGAPSTQFTTDWLFRQGFISGVSNPIDFRSQAWWPRFRDFQQGIGALAGGDVSVIAGGSITNLAVSTSTVGRLPGTLTGGSPLSGLDVRGGGDVTVSAGDNVGSAFVYVDRGVGRIRTAGSLTSSRSVASGPLYSLFALGDAQMLVQAAGDVHVETVFNPMVAQQQALQNLYLDPQRATFFFTYGANSAVDLRAATGAVTLENRVSSATPIADAYGTSVLTDSAARETLRIYPGTLRALAAAGNIDVKGAMDLYPSPQGGVELLAGNGVRVSQTIFMSDVSPNSLPRPGAPDRALGTIISPLILAQPYQTPFSHSSDVLHASDPEPVRIVALNGDITGPANGSTVMGIFAKSAMLSAGGDVRNAYFIAQNMRAADVSRVSAGNDVIFDLLRDRNGVQITNDGRFDVAGPGRLEIFAGRNVDLGNSMGAVTNGNLFNPYLPDGGAGVVVQAGAGKADYARFIDEYIVKAAGGESYRDELGAYMRRLTGIASLSDDDAFARYDALPADRKIEFANQVFYAELKASGRFAARTAGGLERYSRGFAAIDTLFPEQRNGARVNYDGDVSLFFSQIKTEQGGDIDIMAPGGLVNAGLANPGQLNKLAANLGVLSLRGGTIRSYVRDDFLVNQSRVFTLLGGDILLWASYGDIDAGRGAKTASATPPPRVVIRNDKVVLDATNSVSGSGIGVLLAAPGVKPGDVDLIAPRGEVNAGDAGIRVAGNLNIAALRVVGADNILVGGASTGVPVVQSTGALASVAAGAGSTAAAATQNAAELARTGMQDNGFRPSFITVKVLGFGS
jgi:filamentous hemagglutinin family protein